MLTGPGACGAGKEVPARQGRRGREKHQRARRRRRRRASCIPRRSRGPLGVGARRWLPRHAVKWGQPRPGAHELSDRRNRRRRCRRGPLSFRRGGEGAARRGVSARNPDSWPSLLPSARGGEVQNHIHLLRALDLEHLADGSSPFRRRLPVDVADGVPVGVIAQLFELPSLTHLSPRMNAQARNDSGIRPPPCAGPGGDPG